MFTIPVLKYHRVTPFVKDSISIHPDDFEQHLILIKKLSYKSLFMPEIFDIIYKKGHIPSNKIAITFDDGFFDNWLYVFPLLKKYQIKATIFITTDFINNLALRSLNPQTLSLVKTKTSDCFKKTLLGVKDNFLSWEEIFVMQDSGLVDFQSHTTSHKHVFCNRKPIGKLIKDGRYSYYLLSALKRGKEGTAIFPTGESIITRAYLPYSNRYESKKGYRKRIFKEIFQSKLIIEKQLSKPCDFLAWPWGAYNATAIKLAKKVGFKMLMTTKTGSNSIFTRFFDIKRFTPANSVNHFHEQLLKNSYLLPSWCVDEKLYKLFFKRRILKTVNK